MKAVEQFSDLELIERVISGELALFEILIRRNNSFLYKTGRGYNYNHEDTQDLMQDTFIDAFRNLNKFENRSSFKTWIVRIMLNNCFRKKQKLSFRNETPSEMDERLTPMFSGKQNSDTSRSVLNKELGIIVENALHNIPHDYRMVFTLREINGLSVEETAESLQISQSNVKVRLNRAKTMLRNEVEKSYTTEDLFDFNLAYCDAMVNNVMEKIAEISK